MEWEPHWAHRVRSPSPGEVMMLIPPEEHNFPGRADLDLVVQEIGRDGLLNLDLVKIRTRKGNDLETPGTETRLKILAHLVGDSSGGAPRWPRAGDERNEAAWDIGGQEKNLLGRAFVAHCDLNHRWRLNSQRAGYDLLAYWRPVLDSDMREKFGRQVASEFGRSHTGDPRRRLSLRMDSAKDLNEFVNGLIYQASYLNIPATHLPG